MSNFTYEKYLGLVFIALGVVNIYVSSEMEGRLKWLLKVLGALTITLGLIVFTS